MRKTIATLTLSAAASSLMLVGSAHAATSTMAGPGDRPYLHHYDCLFRGPAPAIYPPMINGELCAALDGAPEGWFAPGPVRITIRVERTIYICQFANAENYPESVLGTNCFPEDQGPY